MSGDCWVWTGARAERGYGIVSNRGGRNRRRAHRTSWELAHGPIPPGMFVLHRCDNPPCVRAEHLFLGTQLDNMRDMAAKGRRMWQPWLGQDQSGEKNPSAKLTVEKVLAIRAMRAEGAPYAAIVERFGISRAAASLIVNGKRWGHV